MKDYWMGEGMTDDRDFARRMKERRGENGPKLDEGRGTYCSDWCGFGCLKAAHDTAHELARDLAERMGEGWTTNLWENMGWHWEVVSPCGRVKVHPNDLDSFSAFLGEAGDHGGKWWATADTPENAVTEVVAKAKEELSRIGAIIEGL